MAHYLVEYVWHFSHPHRTGIIKLPIFRGIKQCKCMVVLRDFPLIVPCLGWCHVMTPVEQGNPRVNHHYS